MKGHPERSQLEGLVRSSRQPAEPERVMEHLSECEECFAAYERLWAETSTELPDLSSVTLDRATAERIESRLFHRIRLANLGTASAWLVTEGFLQVTVALLLPIVDPGPTPTRPDRGEKQ